MTKKYTASSRSSSTGMQVIGCYLDYCIVTRYLSIIPSYLILPNSSFVSTYVYMSGGSTPNALSPAAETPPSQSSGGDLNLLSTPTTEAPSVPQRSAGK